MTTLLWRRSCAFKRPGKACVALAIALCAITSVKGENKGALFDPADPTSAIDLAQIPLSVDVLRRAGLLFQDMALERKFSSEIQSLKSAIELSLSEPAVGCLLKVVVFVSPEGAIVVPGGSLIAFEGTGRSPTDALATLRSTGGVFATPPGPPFEDQSYYMWLQKENGLLKAWIIPRELRKSLELDAKEESARRAELKKVDEAMTSSNASSISRDEYWRIMADAHLKEIKDSKERLQANELTKQFANAQAQFNDAYEQYLKKEQELQENQKNMQTLEKLSRAIGVVSNAIELGKLASTKDGGSSVTAGPAGMQNPAKVMIEFHEREIKSIRGSIRQWQGIIEIRGAKVQQTDRELLNTFLRNGVKIPESEQKLVLPQKR